MWISLPLPDRERQWLQSLGAELRLSSDALWRTSSVEGALVTDEVWERYHLPRPPAPIVSLDVPNASAAERLLAKDPGVRWEMPYGPKPWGVVAGLLRFPSGLLVELIEEQAAPHHDGAR